MNILINVLPLQFIIIASAGCVAVLQLLLQQLNSLTAIDEKTIEVDQHYNYRLTVQRMNTNKKLLFYLEAWSFR